MKNTLFCRVNKDKLSASKNTLPASFFLSSSLRFSLRRTSHQLTSPLSLTLNLRCFFSHYDDATPSRSIQKLIIASPSTVCRGLEYAFIVRHRIKGNFTSFYSKISNDSLKNLCGFWFWNIEIYLERLVTM
jgi:hypothetical protein